MRIKVGLCGHGYWGQNLLRTFSSDPRFDVVAVSDIRESARDRVRRTNAAIRLYGDGTEVIDDPEVEAVAIATPAATHFSLARRALVRDSMSWSNGVVGKLRQLHQNGSLGAVSYYNSLRVNLGLFQPDLNVLWDLGPHDFSIMDYLFEKNRSTSKRRDIAMSTPTCPTSPTSRSISLPTPSRISTRAGCRRSRFAASPSAEANGWRSGTI